MDAGVPSVQSLVENGTTKVPPRFVRPPENPRDTPSAIASLDDLPVINASQLDQAIELEKLDRACREWGFFQLIGHGIPSSMLQRTLEVINGFFKLPKAEKESYSASTFVSKEGYTRYFIPSTETVLDWGDTFFHGLPPKAIKWPVNPPNYRETIQAYGNEVQALANKLLTALSKCLGQKPDFFKDGFGPDALTSLRMNYYPPCPEPDLVLGLSPHSDGVGITLLLQDEVEGLQIRKDGRWMSVKSIPDALVVNIGDILEIMSNGVYKSVEHRAVVNYASARVSAALFYSPGFNQVIKPLIKDAKPVYREMVTKDFLSSYLSKELRGKDHLKFAKL